MVASEFRATNDLVLSTIVSCQSGHFISVRLVVCEINIALHDSYRHGECYSDKFADSVLGCHVRKFFTLFQNISQ